MVSPRYARRGDAQYAGIGANDSLTLLGLVGYLTVLAGVVGLLSAPVLVGASLAALVFIVATVRLARRLDSPAPAATADRESRTDGRERLAD
ncbi:hypothetical protein KTS45_15525 [Halomicroarcula limicola]|uniref:Uncharacterized protein n=1 Tax=Haloarcula limicola TaxID=1429915 RepID=A0A8J8C9M5_9EURY|nr:hypothetical protein [Halomicroarcula limicola]MBV0925615.1 hypothetical protein [Halomicroarcula limicola]